MGDSERRFFLLKAEVATPHPDGAEGGVLPCNWLGASRISTPLTLLISCAFTSQSSTMRGELFWPQEQSPPGSLGHHTFEGGEFRPRKLARSRPANVPSSHGSLSLYIYFEDDFLRSRPYRGSK